jgi:RNA polymerase sigma factor (sigma-70 family)
VREFATRVDGGVVPPRLTSPRELLLANLDLVQELVRFHARRHALPDEEREELEGYVRLRLLENDYAILRKFEERSTLRTYLTIVIERLFLDYGNQAWGKWRASAGARRLGALAMALEERLYREGLCFEDACQVLLADPHWRTSRAELGRLHTELPPRQLPRQRRLVDSGSVAERVDEAPDPEAVALRRSAMVEVTNALTTAYRRLRAQDRLVVRLRFVEELTVPEIARFLGLPEKTLYKRIKQLLRTLQAGMRAAGVEGRDVAALLSRSSDFELPTGTLEESGPSKGESGASRPSILTDEKADGR